MAPYVPPTSGRAGKLRLDFNENTVGCSPRVIEALAQAATRGFVATYPEYERAREKMGEFLGVKGSRLIFGDGTDELINALVHTYIDPGDEVLMPWPTFTMFRFYTEVVAGVPKKVDYKLPELKFPLEELIEAIGPRTKLITIATPNNPTGDALSLADIEKVLEAATDRAVLIDEAYFEFNGVTAIDLLPHYPNLFVSRTFSKAYGLAGLRVGCLVSSAENIEQVHKGQSPYSVGSIAITCAMAAIDDQDYVSDYVKKILEARALLKLREAAADAKIGQWNRFFVRMRGEYLTVVLNGVTVIDHAHLPDVPASGPIGLQSHGSGISFSNILIRR